MSVYIHIYILYIERSKWLKHTSRHLALHPCISSMAPKCNFNASKAAAARGSQSHKLRASKVDELWHPPLSLEWSVASRHGRSPQVSSHVHGKISLGRFGTIWTTHHSPRTKGAAYLLSTGHQCFEQEKIGLKAEPPPFRGVAKRIALATRGRAGAADLFGNPSGCWGFHIFGEERW